MDDREVEASLVALERAAVAFRTPQGVRKALGETTLHIKRGEWIALVGRNGSGKSTLAKVMAGLCPLSRGQLTVRQGARVRLVLQNPDAQIVGETVREDISFGLENEAVDTSLMDGKVRAALELVGLQAAPERPTRELSGGQKQLLAVAGCLALEADVLIFDEATSMLDPLSRQYLLGVVSSLHRSGTTIVWVTQLLEEAAYASRVVALDGSGVAYDGDSRGFFYERAMPERQGPCERLGFEPPFAVRVAKRLFRLGHALPLLPVAPSELSEGVSALCRSS
jgi:energy-coupling factor transport system ATP-binding protein